MKKITLIFTLLIFAGLLGFGQTERIRFSFGAKGVDSLYGAETSYRYINTLTSAKGLIASTSALSNMYVYSIQAQTIRSSAPTGTDSCHIEVQVSLDNTNWVEYTGAVPVVFGGGVYLYGDTQISTTTNGGGIWTLSIYYPYVRLKFQHYKATCTMYPVAYAVLKKY